MRIIRNLLQILPWKDSKKTEKRKASMKTTKKRTISMIKGVFFLLCLLTIFAVQFCDDLLEVSSFFVSNRFHYVMDSRKKMLLNFSLKQFNPYGIQWKQYSQFISYTYIFSIRNQRFFIRNQPFKNCICT